MEKKASGARLTATYVERIDVTGVHGDGRGGNGLRLITTKRTGKGIAKRWEKRYRVKDSDGKVVKNDKGNPIVQEIPLGQYPAVSLAQARELAKANAALIAAGTDPKTFGFEIPTLEDALKKVIDRDAASRSEQVSAEMRAIVVNHIPSRFLAKRLDKITTIDVRPVFSVIWAEKHSVAKNILRLFKDAFDLALEDGHITKTPIGPNFRRTLGQYPRNRPPHPSLPYPKMQGAVEQIWTPSNTTIETRSSLHSIGLTGLRTRPVRLAEWNEIKWRKIITDEDWNEGEWEPVDWDNVEDSDKQIVWFIPDAHMKIKTGKPFRVPVSTGLLKVLKRMWELRGQGKRDPKLIFASARGGSLGKSTITLFCTELNLPSDIPGRHAVAHGFRSTIRDWAAVKGVPFEVAELMLAHELPPVVGAYVRGDLLGARARLLQAWSDYVDGTLPTDWTWSDSDRKLFAKIEELLGALRRAEERETRWQKRAEEAEERLDATIARLTETEARLAESEDEKRRLEETTRWRQPMLPL